MIGGSTVFGSGLSNDRETIPYQLFEKFNEKYDNVEVINAGISSITSFDELYIIENILVNNKTKGLPAVHLYISERGQRKLLENTPISTKKWIGGHFLLDDGNLKKIKIRHRGDNPRNWMFEKKHWRIKTRKNETLIEKGMLNIGRLILKNFFQEVSQTEWESYPPNSN